MAEDRTGDMDGYTVNFVSITRTMTWPTKRLPRSSCWCPHWGYVIKRRGVRSSATPTM